MGTVSSDDKFELVRKVRADWVVNYERQDFAAETDGRGVDVILDAVGKPTFEKGLRCLAPLGHIILYGRAGGAPSPVNPLELFGKSSFALELEHVIERSTMKTDGADWL
jgi:NADPH2:quinone reductase